MRKNNENQVGVGFSSVFLRGWSSTEMKAVVE